MDDLLTVRQLANEWGVTPQRIYQFIDEGRLAVERFPKRRDVRVRRSEAIRFQSEREIPKVVPA